MNFLYHGQLKPPEVVYLNLLDSYDSFLHSIYLSPTLHYRYSYQFSSVCWEAMHIQIPSMHNNTVGNAG